ncbi:MAG TPA: mannose-1-phosphate guanylyltransferase, partial [Thermoanaerobaculia bacterium]|nr:mannose-1-phosphate guanylyltransferase [Thermoanaerobaculia bacterium]
MIPIVLSGGSGTRLWPVSRASHPKQFVELLGEPLLARTLKRLAPLGSARVLALADQRALTEKLLRSLGLPASAGLYEPMGRNTAPAVALLCRLLELEGRSDEVVGIFPADHFVRDEAELVAACRLAEACARRGQVVTLGIRPTYPATGYGYIEIEPATYLEGEGHRAHRVRRFCEKPDRATAEGFLEAGGYFWNAGMFVFEARVMAAAFARLMPELWQAFQSLAADLSNLEPIYRGLAPESLDFGIMEHLAEQVSIPCDLGWSDVGSWDEVARLLPAGEHVFRAASAGSVVVPHGAKVYGLIGAPDLIVVDTADALL